MYRALEQWLAGQGVVPELISVISIATGVLLVFISALVVHLIASRFLVPVLEKVVRRSSNQWDDTLSDHGFFSKTASILPVIAIYVSPDFLLVGHAFSADFLKRFALVIFVFACTRVLNSFLSGVKDIYDESAISKGRPLRGYFEIVKIIIWVLSAIFAIAVVTDKSPWGIMSVLGGLTAVLLLIFKDTILGFVASLQLSGKDMVREGDWIEMPSYGADGDVIDVSIHTVKVQNWDKTITTIPTYALVSNSFKNWRGMAESGGRRIKRSLHIDMNTISFCTDQMLGKFEKFELLKEYLADKKEEIETYNAKHNIDAAVLANGRRQTNVGVFRAYIIAYLKANPNIHKNMTFLVRHLAPTSEGLPIEIYVFSSDQAWANYEAIQADIFDHILAVIPEFGLSVFQQPSGNDLRNVFAGKSKGQN